MSHILQKKIIFISSNPIKTSLEGLSWARKQYKLQLWQFPSSGEIMNEIRDLPIQPMFG